MTLPAVQSPMHPTLLRQIERHLGAEPLPERFRELLDAVSRAYEQAAEERRALEERLEEAARERGERLQELRRELAERESAEREREHALERYRLAGLATNDTLWEWELETGAGSWNEGIHATFGYPPGEVQPTHQWWVDRVHPDDLERVLAETNAALEGRGESWEHEYRFRRGDGTYATVLDRGHVQRGPGGQAVRVVGSIHDITGRKRAEEALRESERQFRDLVETVAAATFIYRGDRFLYVNEAGVQLTGYTREELLEMHFWEVVHPEHREAVRERGMARQRGEWVTPRYEFKIVTREGEERWVDFTGGSVAFRGEPAALGTAFDITRHKRAEEELQRQALTFENLYDAVVITGPDGRVVNWNPAAERIYGYTEEEARGLTPGLWLHPDDSARAQAMIRDALEREGRWSGELRFLCRDGREGISETLVVPLFDAAGERIGTLGVNRDVTARKRAEEALRESEQRYRLMVEGSEQVFFYVHDAEGVFEYLSPSIHDVLGYDPAQVVGQPYHVLLTGDPSDAVVVEQTQATLATQEGLTTYTAVCRHRDGRKVVMELVETAVMEGAAAVGVQGFARDITERKRAEEALRESEQRYRALFEESRDAIYMTTLDGRFIDANQAALELFGRTREELLAMDARGVYLHAADRERFQDEILRTGFVRDYEVRLLRQGGEAVDCLLSATVRRAPDGSVVGYQGIIHDITARKRTEEQLAYGALHDALTGLPNRALFVDRLGHAIERVGRAGEMPFAVLFLDLDRFKVINDSLGHGVGDELLVAIAERLERTLRPGDTVARFGGDEFTILLDHVPGVVDATHVAERVLAALSAPFALERHEVFTSASVGIALSSTGSSDPEELLRNADAALSRAKVLGKARYEVFDRAMHAEAMGRLRLEMDLRRALERGEFRLFYQPVVELGSGRIAGFEALLRWKHPERGMVMPRDFIPVAEETGLILPVGRWVVEEVCRHLRAWRGGSPNIGINLSARQFAQPGLAEHLEETLRAAGLDPARLTVEITESVILEDAEPAKAHLARLRELGVELYMDDFGTGYSSLGYLHRFPLDGLKVDRSFVAVMDRERRNAQLVEAIIGLARTLGVRVVAEGIESAAQLAVLREMGCEFGQGFFFSQPLPRRQAEELMASGRTW